MISIFSRFVSIVALFGTITSCTIMQTFYFLEGYTPLYFAENDAFEPYDGTPGFDQVNDMPSVAQKMHGDGYVMLSCLLFVGPLIPGIRAT